MAAPDKVFGKLTRPLRRKRISTTEVSLSIFISFLLGLVVFWFFSQKDNFDPSTRDVSIELLKGLTFPELYEHPLKRISDNESGITSNSAPDITPFPPVLLSHQWTAVGSAQSFTPENLYEKINGQAEQYLQFGFKKLSFLTISHQNYGQVDLYLYNMGSETGSLGVFAEQRDEHAEVFSQGDLYYTPTSIGGSGIKGSFFFQVLAMKSPLPKDSMGHFLKTLNQLPASHGTASLFSLFAQKLNIPFAHIRFQKSNVFQYGFTHDYWFARSTDHPESSYFIHRAASPQKAREEVSAISKEHLTEYMLLKSPPGTTLFKHKYIPSYFSLSHKDALVFGVEGSSSEEILSLEHAHLNSQLVGEHDE